jgi:small conductance mechanosensitive channel
MQETVDGFSGKLIEILNEYWTNFLFTLPRILIAIVVLAAITFIAMKLAGFVNKRLTLKAPDPLFSSFIVQLLKYGLILIGVMISFQIVGLSGIAGGLLAGAGVSALIFGFAFKDIGENFLAGIILAFNRPFNYHDTIKVADFLGRVEGMSFRITHLKTFDEKDVFIPNAVLVKEVLINLTRDGSLRLDFVIGIAYEDNLDEAIKLIIESVNKCSGINHKPVPFAVVEEFSASTINIRVYFWTATDDYRRGVLILKGEIMTQVKNALISRGFTLPANIQELKIYGQKTSLPITIINNQNE